MIVDPLTKAGAAGFATRLTECMTTGHLRLEASVDSQMKKLRQQKAKRDKALSNDPETEPELEDE